MGWNTVNFAKDSKFSSKLAINRFYFVHSYFAKCNDSNDILGTTNYSLDFVSSVKKKYFWCAISSRKKPLFWKTILKNFLRT